MPKFPITITPYIFPTFLVLIWYVPNFKIIFSLFLSFLLSDVPFLKNKCWPENSLVWQLMEIYGFMHTQQVPVCSPALCCIQILPKWWQVWSPRGISQIISLFTMRIASQFDITKILGIVNFKCLEWIYSTSSYS